MTWLAVSALSFGGMAEVAERMESTLSEKNLAKSSAVQSLSSHRPPGFSPIWCRTLSATISSSFPCFQQFSHASECSASPCPHIGHALPSVVWATPAGQHPHQFFGVAVQAFGISPACPTIDVEPRSQWSEFPLSLDNWQCLSSSDRRVVSYSSAKSSTDKSCSALTSVHSWEALRSDSNAPGMIPGVQEGKGEEDLRCQKRQR